MLNQVISVFLATIGGGGIAGIAIATAVVGLLIGIFGGIFVYKFYAKNQITNVTKEKARILEEGRLEAANMRKEALLEAKDEQHKLRSEFDQEIKDRRNEIQKVESRLIQREDNLDKKEQSLDKRQEMIENIKSQLDARDAQLEKLNLEISQAHNKTLAELEKVSGLSSEEAKKILMDELLEEAKSDASAMAREIENNAKNDAEKRARNIIGQAIQRCAADHVSDVTVSVVSLPNDEMKGRIIGRVGRNIRALENATGVDLIIDDTPDVVTLSAFDPVRREVAKITLEKLIADGRIHPARIEEMVEKVKLEVKNQIKEAGESAAFDAGVYGLHGEIVRLLGRLKFRTSYGQNVLNHSLEVAYLSGIMAAELGADIKIAKRGGLLHDIGKAVDHDVEGTHIQLGVELAKKYKESKEVIHIIEAHHGDVQPETIEAVIVQAADAISSARPGARRESLENYVKRLEKLETIANSFKGVEQSYAIQAGREIRVMVKPEVVDDNSTLFMAKEIAKKLESELEYPGQIKVNVIREFRSVEYAK